MPQLSTLKDGRWGLLDGRLAWQACLLLILILFFQGSPRTSLWGLLDGHLAWQACTI